MAALGLKADGIRTMSAQIPQIFENQGRPTTVTMMTIVGGAGAVTFARQISGARGFSYASHPTMKPSISGGKCRYACSAVGVIASQTVG